MRLNGIDENERRDRRPRRIAESKRGHEYRPSKGLGKMKRRGELHGPGQQKRIRPEKLLQVRHVRSLISVPSWSSTTSWGSFLSAELDEPSPKSAQGSVSVGEKLACVVLEVNTAKEIVLLAAKRSQDKRQAAVEKAWR